MGLRETLNRRPLLSAGVVALVIVAAILIIYLESGRRSRVDPTAQAYFTVDDGKTLFAADGAQMAPFDHDAAEAVRAHVYLVNGEQKVGYLEKYTAQALARMQQAIREHHPALAQPMPGDTLVKRPRDAGWVPDTMDRADAIMAPPPSADGRGAREIWPGS